MNKNHWEEVAKMFGLELGEEFWVLDENGEKYHDRTFTFSEDGFLDSAKCDVGGLSSILSRECTIKKIPWKPKDGEIFWFVAINGEVCNTEYSGTSSLNRLRYKSGNCFKTKKEAEQNADRIVAMLESDELFK